MYFDTNLPRIYCTSTLSPSKDLRSILNKTENQKIPETEILQNDETGQKMSQITKDLWAIIASMKMSHRTNI